MIRLPASGDLRNAMETVNKIPSGYDEVVNIVVNDSNELVSIRNSIILLLIFMFPDGSASEIIVYLWY
jgi:hypothetical protein